MSEDEEDHVSLEAPLSPRSTKNAKHDAAKRKRQAGWPEDRKEHEKQRLAFYGWQGRQLKELYASPEYQNASEADKPALVENFKANCRLQRIAEGKHHSLTFYGLSQAEKFQAQPNPVPLAKVTPPIPLMDTSVSTVPAAQHSYLSTLPESQRLYLIQPDDKTYHSLKDSTPRLTTSDDEDSSVIEELESELNTTDTTRREEMMLDAKIKLASVELQRFLAEREQLRRKQQAATTADSGSEEK